MNDPYWAFMKRNESLYWKGFSQNERVPALDGIEKIIQKYGFLTDFHMFSDVEISFRIEIGEQKIRAFHTDLALLLNLDNPVPPLSESTQERVIFLNVTFLKSTGDFRNEVPAVPG